MELLSFAESLCWYTDLGLVDFSFLITGAGEPDNDLLIGEADPSFSSLGGGGVFDLAFTFFSMLLERLLLRRPRDLLLLFLSLHFKHRKALNIYLQPKSEKWWRI